MSQPSKKKDAAREIILYLVFGGLTTVVSWGTYMLFANDNLLGLGITLSKFLSWVCAVLFAFFTNKSWVFQSHNWGPRTFFRELASFFGARAVTGALEIFGTPALVHAGVNQKLFGTTGMLANILVSIIVVILNYVFSKLFVFTKGRKKGDNGAGGFPVRSSEGGFSVTGKKN